MSESPKRSLPQDAEGAAPLTLESASEWVRSAPVGCLLYQDGCIIYANETASRLLGYSDAELLAFGKEQVKTIIWGDDQPTVFAAMERLAPGKTLPPVTHRIRSSDGTAVWVDGYASRLIVDGRPATRVLFFDVSRRVATEQSLRESEQRYRQLVETSPLAIAVHSEGAIVFVNAEAVRLLRASGPEELLGRSIMEVAHSDDHSLTRQRMAASYSGKSPGPGLETRMIRVDGSEVWVDASSGPVIHHGHPAAQVVFRDATARRKAEAENALLGQQLLQAQKLEAVGRLAGGVAHDFNNLLTEISGNAALALMDLQPGDETHKAFSAIQDASRRAAALTRQLLAFSRKQVFQPTLVDLDALVGNMEDMLRRLLGVEVFLKTHLHTRGSYLMADPGQLEQVLLNLCINARDAMPDGGTITISANSTDADAGLRSLCPKPGGGAYLRLSVADTGLGMAEETLAHIFEPFFTTKSADKGTGLGLSTTYGIVQQHGGTVAVDSTPGSGTVFHVWFPVTSGTPILPRPLHGETLLMGSELILYVEDEPVVREVTTAILERLGYRVLVAAAPREALAILEGQDPFPALLLSDVILPEMNGRELSERATVIAPNMKVLLTSGYSHNIVATDGQKPVPNFIGKPSTPRALSMKLREILDAE